MTRPPNLGELHKLGRTIMIGTVILAGPALIALSIGSALIALVPLGLAAVTFSFFILVSHSDLGEWGLNQLQGLGQSL